MHDIPSTWTPSLLCEVHTLLTSHSFQNDKELINSKFGENCVKVQ